MGFRNKHRRGRGGGGGGGGQQHHHHHGFGTGEPNGLQPGDDIGNRKSFKPVQHPPDDLGNRKDPDEVEFIPVDDVGNRVDAAPTHEMSGTLMDVDGKGRRRRRPKGVAAPERVGRFFVGGVNPLIATNTPRPFPGKTLEESFGGPSGGSSGGGSGGHAAQPSAHAANDDRGDDMHGDGPRDDMGGTSGASGAGDGPRDDGEFEGEGSSRRRRRRGRGGRSEGRFEQVDGVQAQEVSERRAQRFFDFDEDDRFEYTLKTTAEQKRKDAEDAVKNVVTEAGRDGVVLARLIEDGTRPKVLVTIDERGPAASVPPERRAHNANEPLFVMGNAALMSLNYLVNKIVNRYPDDRIRLAILPAADERLYLDALADHQKLRRAPGAPTNGAPANGEAATTSNASLPTPVVATPPSAPRSVPAVATPAPIGPAAPPEAFDEAMEKPKPAAKEPKLAQAEERIAEKVKHLEREQSEADESDESDEDEDEDEDESEDAEGEEDESIDSKPKATPKKKAKAAPKKKAAEKPAAKKAPAKKAAKKPVVEKATVKKR